MWYLLYVATIPKLWFSVKLHLGIVIHQCDFGLVRRTNQNMQMEPNKTMPLSVEVKVQPVWRDLWDQMHLWFFPDRIKIRSHFNDEMIK